MDGLLVVKLFLIDDQVMLSSFQLVDVYLLPPQILLFIPAFASSFLHLPAVTQAVNNCNDLTCYTPGTKTPLEHNMTKTRINATQLKEIIG